MGVPRACPQSGAGPGQGRCCACALPGGGTAEKQPGEAQSNTDCGASERRQACIAEEKAKPAGKKGLGCEGKPVGQPVAKLVFRPHFRAHLGSFLRTSARSGREGSWWVGEKEPKFSDSAMHQLCDHGPVPAPGFGLLRFQ